MKVPEELRRVVATYGGAPLLRRTISSPPERVKRLRENEGGLLGAAGLVWNRRGEVLLVREHAPSEDRVVWIAPGGMARPGEGPEEAFQREVEEETGLRPAILDLTYIFDLTVTDGREASRGFLFQFEGLAEGGDPRPGEGVVDLRWFADLPEDMAFRGDYLEAFEARRRGPPDRRFPPGA